MFDQQRERTKHGNGGAVGPVVAAYVVGRLWNQLCWFMPQVRLSGNLKFKETVEKIANELGLQVRFTRPPEERTPLQEALRNLLKNWCGQVAQPQAAHDLYDANRELNTVFGHTEDFEAERTRICIQLLTPTENCLHEIESCIYSKFNSKQKVAWEMGVAVDRGLCPADVVERMFLQLQHPITSQTPRESTFGGASGPERDENLLFTRLLQPGQVNPNVEWLANVTQQFEELGIDVSSVVTSSKKSDYLGRRKVRPLVAFLDDLARKNLEQVNWNLLQGKSVDQSDDATSPLPKAKRDKKMEQRNQWIYQQRCKGREMPDRLIFTNLNVLALKKGWPRINSIQGMRAAGNAHAAKIGKPIPPRINL